MHAYCAQNETYAQEKAPLATDSGGYSAQTRATETATTSRINRANTLLDIRVPIQARLMRPRTCSIRAYPGVSLSHTPRCRRHPRISRHPWAVADGVSSTPPWCSSLSSREEGRRGPRSDAPHQQNSRAYQQSLSHGPAGGTGLARDIRIAAPLRRPPHTCPPPHQSPAHLPSAPSESPAHPPSAPSP